MNNPVWKNQTVTLIKPLQRDSGSTAQVLVQMITHAQHAALVDQYGSEDDNNRALYRELVKAGTGLTDTDINALVMPDYNSLIQTVDEAYGKDSAHWFKKLGVAFDETYDRLPLLVPLLTTEGERGVIELQFPSVAAVELMHKQQNDDQFLFILSSCTGLGAEELKQLSPPDWKSLSNRVADFLSQTGSFFLPATK